MSPEDARSYVRKLHALVDELTAPIAAAHGKHLVCKSGCSACCVDGLTVFEVEADILRESAPDLFQEAPAAVGCALLGPDGACRAYAARPYVCRTQGLPLRWAEDGVERRDICTLNDVGPVEALPVAACWTLGPVEARLRTVQEAVDGGEGRRVALRDLFGPQPRA